MTLYQQMPHLLPAILESNGWHFHPSALTNNCSGLGSITALFFCVFFMENHKILLLLNEKYPSAFPQ